MNQLQTAIHKIASIAFITLFCCSSYAQPGYAVSFDGTNDYMGTSSYVVPTSGDFTVEFWAYAANYTGYQEFVSQGSSGTAFYIGTTNSTGVIRCGDSWGPTGITMPLNQWVHIALVKSGGSAILYLNGIQKASLASGYAISSAGTSFQMGTQYGGLGEYFNGKLDELRVWNVACTQAQIKANMFGKYVPVSSTGLVAYYKMNEGSGTTAANSCTNTSGIDGTLTNGPAWAASPIQFKGNSLYFDQVDDRVIAPLATTATSNVTMELWINHDGGTGTDHLLVSNGVMGTNGYALYINTQRKLIVQFNAVGAWNTNYVFTPGQWTHIALVINTTGFIVYINGVNVYSNTATAITPTGNFILGYNTVAGGQPYDGRMDEVRVWNTARTQTQVQNNMNTEIDPSTSGLALYYTFDQGIAGGDNTGIITVVDQSANNNGTLTNFSLSGSTSNLVAQNSSLMILPLKWVSFTAQQKDNQMLLQWSTASEINVNDFMVERSDDGKQWETIGGLPSNSHGATNVYHYTDASPLSAINYYRIREIDIDGKYSYSETLLIRKNASSEPFKIISNPAINKTLQLQISTSTKQYISLYGSNGDLIWRKELSPGLHSINVNTVPAGMYIIGNETNSKKIILQ